jgi:hypothetical protein
MACLDDVLLLALHEGTLDAAGVARVDAHADACADCRALVADVMLARAARSSGSPPAPARSLSGNRRAR